MAKTLDIECHCGHPHMRFGMSITTGNKIGNVIFCDYCGRYAYYLFPIQEVVSDFREEELCKFSKS